MERGATVALPDAWWASGIPGSTRFDVLMPGSFFLFVFSFLPVCFRSGGGSFAPCSEAVRGTVLFLPSSKLLPLNHPSKVRKRPIMPAIWKVVHGRVHTFQLRFHDANTARRDAGGPAEMSAPPAPRLPLGTSADHFATWLLSSGKRLENIPELLREPRQRKRRNRTHVPPLSFVMPCSFCRFSSSLRFFLLKRPSSPSLLPLSPLSPPTSVHLKLL